MTTFFIFACLFSAGFLAGSSFKHARFNKIPWEAYRWDENIFGWRPNRLVSPTIITTIDFVSLLNDFTFL